MDKDEREGIINEAVERALLKIPEIIGNLITDHASKLRANKQFYAKYPEFKEHKDVVAAILESIESDDITKPLDKMIEEAVPKIRRRITEVKQLNLKSVSRPNLSIGHGEL
jgi:hypothetical protein